MTGKILPNAFQTPNVYVDTALGLLTPQEWKCLSFAIRHILGWQDKINKRRGVISVTTFERGFTTADGTVFGGTGLTRAAIIKSTVELARFQLLIPTEITPDGQEYELGQSPDWDAMLERAETWKEQNRKRTKKATDTRQAKQAGTSDEPGYSGTSDEPAVVRATNQSQYVPRTDGGTSDELNQNHLQSQVQNQEQNHISPDGEPHTSPSQKKARKPHKNAPWHDALATAFGHQPDALTRTLDKSFWTAAADLSFIQFPVERVADLHRFVKNKAQRERWNSFSVMSLAKYAPEFLQQHPGQPDSETQPVVDIPANVGPLQLSLDEFRERARKLKGNSNG